MAQEINAQLVIKVFLVVVSAVLGAFFLFRLYHYFVSDLKPFSDTNSATLFVSLAAGLVLSALAFWGAFAENHILCYISLCTAICLTVWFILQILRCLFDIPKLFDKENCETMDYVWRGLSTAGSVFICVAIFVFIESIKRH